MLQCSCRIRSGMKIRVHVGSSGVCFLGFYLQGLPNALAVGPSFLLGSCTLNPPSKDGLKPPRYLPCALQVPTHTGFRVQG